METENLEVKMVVWQLIERDNLAGQVLSETLFIEQEFAEAAGNELIREYETQNPDVVGIAKADTWTVFPDGSMAWSYGAYSLTIVQREILG